MRLPWTQQQQHLLVVAKSSKHIPSIKILESENGLAKHDGQPGPIPKNNLNPRPTNTTPAAVTISYPSKTALSTRP